MTIANDKYDYRKLLDQIKQKGYSYSSLADAMNLGRSTLYTKLHNQSAFTQTEIKQLSLLLDLKPAELAAYFFTPVVRKTVHET
ncbi:DUF739 family protein [Lacticaseibacillus salsurivasis]|uniref:DUF739 family protein n=1 Tax=Lacticaseibacillus salsurivasis TaxID=3081441 RepID=UPI0030C6B694